MVKRQIALTRARATLSQMARKGGIQPGEVVEVTRRGQVVLVVQRPEDFAQRVPRLSKSARPGKLWGTAVILGDLEEASRVAEARVRVSLGRRAKQV
jgi:hypothetical protein